MIIKWCETSACILMLLLIIIHEIRETKKKNFLAKLMDCTYVRIGHGDFYIPKNEREI